MEEPAIFSTFRNDLNDTLEVVGMQFKEGKDFETGQNILVLVSFLAGSDRRVLVLIVGINLGQYQLR